MSDLNLVKQNLERVFKEIESGNNLGEKINLVLATKTVDEKTVYYAIKLGATVVGENKVQELNSKKPLVTENAEWHFIGHLQSNKANLVVGNVQLIESVHSIELAHLINKISIKKGVISNVLVQVNIGEQETKSGFSIENAMENCLEIAKLENVNVLGYMAMLPHVDDEDYLGKLCDDMRALFDKTKEILPIKYLSVGMSGDYKIAIKHGSNMIRLGSAVFGERKYF